MTYLYIALGGALGALSRYGMSNGMMRLLGNGFPYGTAAVNLLGALVMGLLFGLFAKYSRAYIIANDELHALFIIGFLGAFTTFSTFALDVVNLYQRGEMLAAVGYVGLSVVGSVAALMLGMWLVRLV